MYNNSETKTIEIIKDIKEEILKLKINEEQKILDRLSKIPLNYQEEVKNGQTRT